MKRCGLIEAFKTPIEMSPYRIVYEGVSSSNRVKTTFILGNKIPKFWYKRRKRDESVAIEQIGWVEKQFMKNTKSTKKNLKIGMIEIMRREFCTGRKVLLYNSRLKLFLEKLIRDSHVPLL